MEFIKQHKNYLVFLAVFAIFDFFVWRAVFANAESYETALYFLDVGQGDSQLVNLAGGVQIMIDGGPATTRVLQELSEILPPGDTYIDLLVMTHPQLDHFGGFIDVLKKYEVGAFIGNGRKAEISAYTELENVIAEKNIPYIVLGEGDKIRYGEHVFSVLSPNTRELASKELNDTSLVIQFTSGNLKALYTGDIGFKGINVEKRLADEYDLSSSVLKVPHHGSKFSSSKAFVEDIKPAVAVIGVGKNSYGHPTKEAIARIMENGTRIMRTDQNGTIKIVVSGDKLRIYAEKP